MMSHSMTRDKAETGFAAPDRHVLLTTRGIGPVVVERLEQAGFRSLQQLRDAGPEAVVAEMCAWQGSAAWGNRRRAIHRAIAMVCGGE